MIASGRRSAKNNLLSAFVFFTLAIVSGHASSYTLNSTGVAMVGVYSPLIKGPHRGTARLEGEVRGGGLNMRDNKTFELYYGPTYQGTIVGAATLLRKNGYIYFVGPNYGSAWDDNGYSYITCRALDNSAPVASNLTLTTAENTAGTVTLLATDADGDSLTYSVVTQPNTAHGTVIISGNVAIFTPKADWNGTTSFTYRANDGKGDSNTATVTIEVLAVNDAPVAQAKAIETNEDTAGTVTLTATDIDSPTPTVFEIVSGPAQGTAAISGSVLTYTPPANWSGTTSLTYRAKDSAGAWSSPATVTVTVNPVNDAPVAQAKAIETNEDTAGTVTLTATDIDSPTPTVFEIVSGPAQGTAAISGSVLTYTPPANWSGTTSLTYRAKDSAGAWSSPATVTVTVNPVNDAPVAQAKSITAAEDSSGTVTLTVTDPDIVYGDSHTFEIVTAPNAAHGSASISGSTLTFTPVANWNGSTSLTYRAKDEAGAYSAAATVSITITAVNDAPVAEAKSAITDEDVPAIITLSAIDIDSPAPTVFEVVEAPNSIHGTVSISGGTATFTPAVNWHGVATFTYRAQDSLGAWSSASTVSVTVTPVNDPPVSSGLGLQLNTNELQPATVIYRVNQ